MTDQASMDALPAPLLREGWVHRDGILTSSDFIRTDPENYPEELREWLASGEPRHAWFRVRAELIARCVAARADLDGWLDLGCGTGFVLKAVARRYGGPCFGQDVSLRALRIARRQCNATLFCGEPGSLPLSGLSAVGLLDVIEHLEDHLAALRAAAGYVKPGGLVIVTVPAHPWLWSSVDVASGHQRRYRRRRLISTLRSAGLVVECCQPFFFSLVPVLAARRLASERDASTTLTTSLRPPPPWLDRVMEAVLAFDASLARRRLLPTGTSWLAVGRTVHLKRMQMESSWRIRSVRRPFRQLRWDLGSARSSLSTSWSCRHCCSSSTRCLQSTKPGPMIPGSTQATHTIFLICSLATGCRSRSFRFGACGIWPTSRFRALFWYS